MFGINFVSTGGVLGQKVIARAASRNAALGVGMRFEPFNPAAARDQLLDGLLAASFSVRRYHDLHMAGPEFAASFCEKRPGAWPGLSEGRMTRESHSSRHKARIIQMLDNIRYDKQKSFKICVRQRTVLK